MAGLYIHIPYCRQACHYCDFHFSTSQQTRNALIKAICKEIEIRAYYLDAIVLDSIYFGGGTPSLLQDEEIDQIFSVIYKHYSTIQDVEITVEANPDDIDKNKLAFFVSSGINRLSLGVQSFYDDDLKLLNRSHHASTSKKAINIIRDSDINTFSIDLIYGIPGMDQTKWKNNLSLATDLSIPHLSCYCLSVEEKTALNHFIQKGIIPGLDEDLAADQFSLTMKYLSRENYIQYEISNYCKSGNVSKHNSNYWNHQPYIGIGPSAHSFNGSERSWNVSNNYKYINSIMQNQLPATSESLTTTNFFNEYILTGLRTIQGCDTAYIQDKFGDRYTNHFITSIQSIPDEWINNDKNCFQLTDRGKLFADKIAETLFFISPENS